MGFAHLLLYPQHLKQCLAQMYILSKYWMNNKITASKITLKMLGMLGPR